MIELQPKLRNISDNAKSDAVKCRNYFELLRNFELCPNNL